MIVVPVAYLWPITPLLAQLLPFAMCATNHAT
jgi:hypothetical protein